MIQKNNIKIFIKKYTLTLLFSLFLIFLVIYSQTNLFAAQKGLLLWAKNVVPALFPFFIATELLNYTNVPKFLGRITNRFMRPLFNVPRRS
jgi:nucleoside recognition membrane protein YjiH